MLSKTESKKDVRFSVYFFVFFISIFVYTISMMIDMINNIPTMNDEIVFGISSKQFAGLVASFGIGVSIFMIFFYLEVMVKAFSRDRSVGIFGDKK